MVLAGVKGWRRCPAAADVALTGVSTQPDEGEKDHGDEAPRNEEDRSVEPRIAAHRRGRRTCAGPARSCRESEAHEDGADQLNGHAEDRCRPQAERAVPDGAAEEWPVGGVAGDEPPPYRT